MKKLFAPVLLLVAACVAFHSCSDTETYADKLKKEKAAIANLIRDSAITVITQQQFVDQGYTTNLERNEFVQTTSGVYMQIIDKGGDAPSDTIRPNDIILVRFKEWRLNQDSIAPIPVCTNLDLSYMVDEFRYMKQGGTEYGLFKSGIMYSTYGSESVPAAWIIPFSYVRNGASVKLIVPSEMGHTTAQSYTYAYYYYIRRYQIFR